MRVIFLDIDGVLNYNDAVNEHSEDHPDYPRTLIYPDCQGQLRRVMEATGAKIVISSSWRRNIGMFLPKQGQKLSLGLIADWIGLPDGVVSATPQIEHRVLNGIRCERGTEIQVWVANCPEVRSYAILDDGYDDHMPPPHMVRTSGYGKGRGREPELGGGLTSEKADQAIGILLSDQVTLPLGVDVLQGIQSEIETWSYPPKEKREAHNWRW